MFQSLYFFYLVSVVLASHFRGGTISWKYKGPSNEFIALGQSNPDGGNDVPVFLYPTPPNGQFLSAAATETLTVTFSVTSNAELVSVDIFYPDSATVTNLTKISENQWERVFTWTTIPSDAGSHFVCAQATDKKGKKSEIRCVEIYVREPQKESKRISKRAANDARCTDRPEGCYCSDRDDNCKSCSSSGCCMCDEYCLKAGDCCSDYVGFCTKGCDEISCLNDGICQEHNHKFTRCKCLAGFAGTFCETQIDECASNPCQHLGTCLDFINGYVCQCKEGFTGSNCEIDINECISNPCGHGGVCIDLVNGFKCNCYPGYTGRTCQIDIDECQSSPCYNGTCIDQVSGWTCACNDGYTGQQCQTEIDECQSNPCLHEGTCEDLIDGYICRCTVDATGNNCETWINHCLSETCLNYGNCTNYLDGYTCSCPYPWFGDRCQNKELDVRQNCKDFLYTDCSCRIGKTKLPPTPSHKVEFGAVGFASGLLFTVLMYFLWNTNHRNPFGKNKVDVLIEDEPYENEMYDSKSIFDNNSISTASKTGPELTDTKDMDEKPRPTTASHGKGGCKCFIDHSGFNHLDRADEKTIQKFRCRHMQN